MDDMISRQAAINALIRKRQPVNNGDGTITITMMTDDVIRDVLNELPSVQTETIRCKDCKYCDSYIAEITSDGNMERMEYRCKDFHSSVMPDDYCSRGERRDG